MNLSMKWLADFVKVPEMPAREYSERMTATGSKVEGYEIMGEDIRNVVVGKVLSVEKHPDADKLVVCKIDVNDGEPLQIVTGAKNVTAGCIVPVAKHNSNLPGGVVIKKGKLRGVVSEGMLCSIGELNLTTHDMPGAAEDGILLLGEEYETMIGMDIREALMLSDTVVEFEITPNRPDCLSVIGLARESGASFDVPVSIPTPAVKPLGDGDDIANYLKVDIMNSTLCPRYSARVVKNVKIEPSPLWLRMRLRASGVRPINNIVDITNYVMLEYGQPMHAFDYACLDGSHIIVRNAEEGEKYKSLDDADHVLKSSMLVIADEKKAVALAGIMGGANSEITDSTKTVVFESANFNGPSVRISAKSLGMRTESSARFEKGMDAENTMAALERACELVQLLGAGDVVDGFIDVHPEKKAVRTVKLDPAKINAFLGTNLDADYMRNVLRSLDFKVDGDVITVPSWRDDVECMNDIAEEIIRIYGYNTFEATLFYSRATVGARTKRQADAERICEILCGMGMFEIQTFSFISPKYYDKICLPADAAERNSVVISNPLGEDTSVMRTTALPSMLETLARNCNVGNEKAYLYEMASTYTPAAADAEPTARGAALPTEKRVVTLGMYDATGKTDFYTMKGVIEALTDALSIGSCDYKAENGNVCYHPGKCAKIYAANGDLLGIFGEVHPAVAENYSIPAGRALYAAELDFDAIAENMGGIPQYKQIPRHPAMTRDFSFVCDEALEVGTIEKLIAESCGKILEKVRLFDIYRGPQIGEDKKSVSFSVFLRAADRTLTDEEADAAVAKLLNTLKEKLGVTLRA